MTDQSAASNFIQEDTRGGSLGPGGPRIEVLAPAGTYEGFLAAMKAGADAVYAGGNRFGARAFAGNFSEDELVRAIDYAHLFERKFYLTVNTLVKEREMPELEDYLAPLCERGLDAVIVQDIGVFGQIRETFPHLPIHCSTQMTLTGVEAALYMKRLGASRIIPARELSIGEIRRIREKSGLEVECFVHGALCFSYSGQCLLSSLIGGRSGNRGRCAQPCRQPYRLLEAYRPEEIPHREGRDSNGPKDGESLEKYLMSLRDICALPFLPELAEAGVSSFKIEGRMKRPEYAYEVTKIYREYADLYLEKGREGYRVKKQDMRRLSDLYARGDLGAGYYDARGGKSMLTPAMPGYRSDRQESFSAVREEMERIDPRIPVSGTVFLVPGKPARMGLICRGRRAEVEGDEVQPARTRALSREDVEKQIRRTGDTPFFLEDLEVQMEPGVFLPLRSLNELRRRAFQELTGRLTRLGREGVSKGTARSLGEGKMSSSAWGEEQTLPSHDSPTEALRIPVRALVGSPGQLFAVLETAGIGGVYADCSMFPLTGDFVGALRGAAHEAKDAGKEFFLALPHIFRSRTAEAFERMKDALLTSPCDGFLVRSYEELFWLKESGTDKLMVTDLTLPVMNRRAHRFFLSEGAERDTLSPELNFWECTELCVSQSELTVYGYLPAMVTAQCMRKNTGVCLREKRKKGESDFRASDPSGALGLALQDRMRKSFPVKTDCDYCYNVIYNSAPLSLHGQWEQVKKLSPKSVRLAFSVESEETTRRICAYYAALARGKSCPDNPVADYTKGHFRRGVQ